MNNTGELNSHSVGALKADDALMEIVMELSKAESILSVLISHYGFDEGELTEGNLADIACDFKKIFFMMISIGDYIVNSKRMADEAM